MAITKISSTRHLTKSIKYLQGESHNKNVPERSLDTQAINCVPGHENEMMMETLARFDKADGKAVQGQLITISFSKDELDWHNEEDVEKARLTMTRFIEKSFPNHEAFLSIQADNENENLHVHGVVSNVDMVTGKSLRGNQASWMKLSKITDEVIQEPDIGLTPLPRGDVADKKSMAEIKMAKNDKYVWKDDLKYRISEIMSDKTITDKDSFFAGLQKNGVDARERGKGISYSFVDADAKKRVIRSSKLGTLYGKDEIAESLKQTVIARKPRYDEAFDLNNIFAQIRAEKEPDPHEFDLDVALREGKAIQQEAEAERQEALRKSQELAEARKKQAEADELARKLEAQQRVAPVPKKREEPEKDEYADVEDMSGYYTAKHNVNKPKTKTKQDTELEL